MLEPIQLRLLGPLELVVGRSKINIAGHRQRVVLAMLALNANRVTPVSDLIEAIWDISPPRTARAQIQTCVSGLRKVLSDSGYPKVIGSRAPGYVLKVSADDLDSEQFANLVAGARSYTEMGRLPEAVATLRQALALWRGKALADIDSDLVQRCATRFEDSRLAAVEERVRLDLELGKHTEIIGELAALVNEHPLSERLAGYRMLALYRSGRQADALEVSRRTRTTLVTELGIEPGPELRRLQTAILNNDPELDRPLPNHADQPTFSGVGEMPDADSTVVPRQLPASIDNFTGRESQLDTIRQLLAGALGPNQYAMRVVAISGKAGVGKSTLAIRAAHEVTEAFPDGVLYGDLHNPEGDDVPAKLLARFLHALGTSGSAIPESTPERVELYRSLLADKRVLVVLDDVTSEEQVRSVLPGSPTCAVIATSRMRLSGLPGVRPVDVDVLDTTKSVELLSRTIDSTRVQAEYSAAVELVHLCGGLPLALWIAAPV